MVLVQPGPTNVITRASLWRLFRDRKQSILVGAVLVYAFFFLPQKQDENYNDHLGLLSKGVDVVPSSQAIAFPRVSKSDNAEDKISPPPPLEHNGSIAAEENIPLKTGNKTQGTELAVLPINRPDHKLPQWMIDYFKWHQEQRAILSDNNWNNGSVKFLIMRCLDDDSICGGTSDRLQSLPFQLLMAYQSQRVLLIYWQRPFPLEEFLMPPQGGLDWRVPSYMESELLVQHQDMPLAYAPRASKILTSKQEKLVVWVRDQTHNHGKSDYDQYHEQTNETSRFETVFHDVWRMVLTPAPPVAERVEHWMLKLGLVPGEYASTHVRALYGVHNRSFTDIEEWTENAIRCTTQLFPEGPFFFASDSSFAQQTALDYGRKEGLKVVSRFHDTEPLHMDVKYHNASLLPSHFYDSIVDLYLLGNARAVAYNVGGYGKLGLVMGFDSKAGIQHQKGGVPWAKGLTRVTVNKCELKSSTSTTMHNQQISPKHPISKKGFFVPPMEPAP